MDLKKLGAAGVACLSLLGIGLNAEENGAQKHLAPQKIRLLVCDVGTIDTVAKTEEFLTHLKQLNVDDVPRVGEATQAADPSLAKHAGRVAFSVEINRFKRQDAEIARRNRKMERVYEQLRNSILGNPNNRDIVVAKEYLQTYLMPYSQFITIIDRANSSIAENEKAIGGKDQEDVADSSVFLTVVMQDLNAESKTVQIGNTMVKKTVYTRKAVAKIRNYRGELLFACSVAADSSFRQTSASRSTGHNPASAIQEELMKQIAEKIGSYFTAKLTVKAKGPKKDAEFDEDAVVLYLDGKEFENGGRTVTGFHLLHATCEGYQTIKREITLEPAKGRIVKLVFRKKTPPAAAPQAE
ncbi:MAG: hypothetical protein IJS01_12570 [Lentisphaeria bacterium]|nr:hypothetical protein [Lentisphaeria bacterium]